MTTSVASSPGGELVTVIVPLYNGAVTIGATLASVRAQTWRNIEIIVVDDGSTDQSPAIVETHAAADPRVRLLRQANAGVAAARNAGAAAANGAFIAPIDADDLWAPDKIALQMRAMQEGGEGVGLVYTWYVEIDAEDRVISSHHHPDNEGWVLGALCRTNFVGNGSSSLIRLSAFNDVGGYDPSLRARKAQGCEDLLLCLKVAERYEFRVIRSALTGYRINSATMSNDVNQMHRSCKLVLDQFRASHPQYSRDIDAHMSQVVGWLFAKALVLGRLNQAAELFRVMLKGDAQAALTTLAKTIPIAIRARAARWAKSRFRPLADSMTTRRPRFLAQWQ